MRSGPTGRATAGCSSPPSTAGCRRAPSSTASRACSGNMTSRGCGPIPCPRPPEPAPGTASDRRSEVVMRAVVVYESMNGNTHLVADAIADGLQSVDDVTAEVLGVAHVSDAALAGADVVVVGGPTHVHGMSRPTTRRAAAEDAAEPDRDLELEPDAEGEGLREWFDAVGALPALAAAFDTRLDAPAVITGRASKGIAKRPHRDGSDPPAEPRSFRVTT